MTSTIERFDADGIVLTGGRHLDADIVVTATGCELSPFGDLELDVDGEKVDPSHELTYRALMLSGVPNFVYTVGYTNASWTLKADLVAEYTCRLLAHMREHGYRSVVPVRGPGVGERPFMDFTSGYVLRALDQLPEAGRPRAVAAAAELPGTTGGSCGAATWRTASSGSVSPRRHELPPPRVRRGGTRIHESEGGVGMGLDDKIKNEATETKGKAKEAAGSATNNESLESEGKADQGEAKMKKAGQHVKDAAGDVKDTFSS